MKIAIDCRHIGYSGIGIYLRECLPFFFDSKNDFLLFGNLEKLNFLTRQTNFEIIPCSIKPFSLHDTFAFPQVLLKKINSCSLFYSPYFNIPCGIKIPVYTTIHDIIFPDMPFLTSKPGLAMRMWFYRRAYKRSEKIFTVSNFSKSRIESHLGKSKPVIVTYSAIQRKFADLNSRPEKLNKNNTILFIGNIKKHKGLDCLLQAFSFAKKEGLPHKLIIIGSAENFRSSDKEILLKINSLSPKEIAIVNHVNDNMLMEYITSASLLIQPSLYEGFCLPPLEALILGTNVLISDIPVLQEIYEGFPVTFFKAGDPIDLKTKILLLLKNQEKINLPNSLASKYTFGKTANTILGELK